MGTKISSLPAKTVFNDTDLVIVSTDNGSSYTSEKMTIAQLKSNLGLSVIPKRYKALISQREPIGETDNINMLAGEIWEMIGGDPLPQVDIDFLQTLILVSGVQNEVGSKYKSLTNTSYISNSLTMAFDGAPTAIVLENTLGGVPVFTYNTAGYFICTLAGAFTIDKTSVKFNNVFNDNATQLALFSVPKSEMFLDNFSFLSWDMTLVPVASSNDMFLGTEILIEVYE